MARMMRCNLEHHPERAQVARRVCALGILLAFIAAPSPSFAQTQERAAPQQTDHADALQQLSREEQLRFDELLGDAQRAFEEGEFTHAVDLLQEAQLLYPHPRILYKMARAYERSGQLEPARTHYLLYLKSGDEAADLDHIREEVARLERRLQEPALVTLNTSPQGATIHVDQEAVGVTPLRHRVSPGEHTVQLTMPDHHTELIYLEAKPGDDILIERNLEPSYFAIMFKEDDLLAKRRRSRILGASSAALGLGSGALFLLANSRASRIDAHEQDQTPDVSRQEIDDLTRQHNRFLYGAWGLAALSAAGATWSLLTWQQTRASTEISVSAQGEGAALRLKWSF